MGWFIGAICIFTISFSGLYLIRYVERPSTQLQIKHDSILKSILTTSVISLDDIKRITMENMDTLKRRLVEIDGLYHDKTLYNQLYLRSIERITEYINQFGLWCNKCEASTLKVTPLEINGEVHYVKSITTEQELEYTTMAASFSEYFMSFIHENSIKFAYDQLQKHGLKISEHGFIHYKQRIILKQIVLSLINIAITIGGGILVNYISPLIIK